jgi:hypothetical protein
MYNYAEFTKSSTFHLLLLNFRREAADGTFSNHFKFVNINYKTLRGP